MDDVQSEMLMVTTGVPQGSILTHTQKKKEEVQLQ